MRTSRRGTKAGIAALMSFTLIAAACGGNDDGGADESGTATVPATDAPEEDTGDDSGETEDTGDDSGDTGDESGDTVEESGDAEPDVNDEGDEVRVIEGEIPGGDPVAGGTLRYALEADVDGINPTSSALSSPGLMMGNAVFDTLTAATKDGNFVPYLAESVEPNEDFTVWTVTLREGITFHDGTPLNAEAMRQELRDPARRPARRTRGRTVLPGRGRDDHRRRPDRAVQPDPGEGNRYLPGALSGQLGMVASPAWIDAAVADPTLNQQPVGTGPFVFDSRSEDSITTFVRNDNWWNGEVYLDAIEFVPVTDPASRNDLLFEGDVDALQSVRPRLGRRPPRRRRDPEHPRLLR